MLLMFAYGGEFKVFETALCLSVTCLPYIYVSPTGKKNASSILCTSNSYIFKTIKNINKLLINKKITILKEYILRTSFWRFAALPAFYDLFYTSMSNFRQAKKMYQTKFDQPRRVGEFDVEGEKNGQMLKHLILKSTFWPKLGHHQGKKWYNNFVKPQNRGNK